MLNYERFHHRCLKRHTGNACIWVIIQSGVVKVLYGIWCCVERCVKNIAFLSSYFKLCTYTVMETIYRCIWAPHQHNFTQKGAWKWSVCALKEPGAHTPTVQRDESQNTSFHVWYTQNLPKRQLVNAHTHTHTYTQVSNKDTLKQLHCEAKTWPKDYRESEWWWCREEKSLTAAALSCWNMTKSKLRGVNWDGIIKIILTFEPAPTGLFPTPNHQKLDLAKYSWYLNIPVWSKGYERAFTFPSIVHLQLIDLIIPET